MTHPFEEKVEKNIQTLQKRIQAVKKQEKGELFNQAKQLFLDCLTEDKLPLLCAQYRGTQSIFYQLRVDEKIFYRTTWSSKSNISAHDLAQIIIDAFNSPEVKERREYWLSQKTHINSPTIKKGQNYPYSFDSITFELTVHLL